jgi:hypothetical protein
VAVAAPNDAARTRWCDLSSPASGSRSGKHSPAGVSKPRWLKSPREARDEFLMVGAAVSNSRQAVINVSYTILGRIVAAIRRTAVSPARLIMEMNRLDHEAAVARNARNMTEVRRLFRRMRHLLDRHYGAPASTKSARSDGAERASSR